MALINVVIKYADSEESTVLGKILKLLSSINIQNSKIMDSLQALEEKVTGLETQVGTLQTAIDNDQASDAQVVSNLTALNEEQKAIIADLQTQLAGAINPAAVQALTDRLAIVSTSIDAAITDVSGPNVAPTV
jgi:hypothetical protein